MRYRKSSIHSVSACELRPSAASIAALYPRIACSLDMTPLVRGFSARSTRKPATAQVKPPVSTQIPLPDMTMDQFMDIEDGWSMREDRV
jgi:hypothetical protein